MASVETIAVLAEKRLKKSSVRAAEQLIIFVSLAIIVIVIGMISIKILDFENSIVVILVELSVFSVYRLFRAISQRKLMEQEILLSTLVLLTAGVQAVPEEIAYFFERHYKELKKLPDSELKEAILAYLRECIQERSDEGRTDSLRFWQTEFPQAMKLLDIKLQ